MVKAVADPEMSKPGGVVPARYKFLGSGDCFDHIPYGFVFRVENRIHTVHVAY